MQVKPILADPPAATLLLFPVKMVTAPPSRGGGDFTSRQTERDDAAPMCVRSTKDWVSEGGVHADSREGEQPQGPWRAEGGGSCTRGVPGTRWEPWEGGGMKALQQERLGQEGAGRAPGLSSTPSRGQTAASLGPRLPENNHTRTGVLPCPPPPGTSTLGPLQQYPSRPA